MISLVGLLALGLQLPTAPVSQRSAAAHAAPLSRRSVVRDFAAAAAVLATASPLAAVAADLPPKEQLRTTLTALQSIVAQNDSFVAGLAKGDPTAPQLPPAIPFKVFQKLESTGKVDDDFMEIAIDYCESHRNARDLVKLANFNQLKFFELG